MADLSPSAERVPVRGEQVSAAWQGGFPTEPVAFPSMSIE